MDNLRLWARTADSDLYIAEALLGQSLAPMQSLHEVLAGTVGRTEAGAPYLIHGISPEVSKGCVYALLFFVCGGGCSLTGQGVHAQTPYLPPAPPSTPDF